MATLHNLKIKNFRGIQSFDQNFDNGLICIIRSELVSLICSVTINM
ncbi:putative ATP-dependent endonuclease of OLD family [Bacteroides reticulotermitis]|uniref:ATP-dependent endonuclease of OLD family n=1 Tax=Bacteroides reticulotermitis TaxID=1133319 RepID=A0A840D056_9BACE|nr:putative ATP-dependent endonuclease of OLD family [Bacteroides reticulotermitis]